MQDIIWRQEIASSLRDIFLQPRISSVATWLSLLVGVIGLLWMLTASKGGKARWVLSAGVIAWMGVTVVLLSYHKEVTINHAQLYAIASKSFGIAKDDLSRVVQISADGSVKSTLMMTIRAISQDVPKVEHKYEVPTNPNPNAAEKFTIGPIQIKGTGGHVLVPEPAAIEGRKAAYILRIEPTLEKGSSMQLVDPLEQTADAGTMFVSKKAMEDSRLPYDYSAMELRYPCNNLTIEVIFPVGFMVTDEAMDVWLGDARVQQTEELQYLQENKEKFFFHWLDRPSNQFHLKLEVPFPRWGLTYAIRWVPVK